MAILGIDIGGTKTTVGVSDKYGNLLIHKTILTPGVLGPEITIGMILPAAVEVMGKCGQRIRAIGIGCGGPLDRETGELHDVPNLPGWQGLRLTEIFSEELAAPAYIDNDATAAALGELMFGAGKGVSDFVYFTVSTGIGGGIVANGHIYRGHNGNAGEFGHQVIRPDGPACPCGKNGCLEALASGTSIARIARERLSKDTRTSLWDRVESPEGVTAEFVAKAAAEGDEFALGIWNEAMENLGLGVANVVNILNPKLVILGGGVTRAGDLLFEPVRRVVKERAMDALADGVEIVSAKNGDLVGLMGAVAVAAEQIT